jgi:Raf kinase inhibitor-like YbhB/YbcL family protein
MYKRKLFTFHFMVVISAVLLSTLNNFAQINNREIKMIKINLTSTSFKNGELIPPKYTCDGKNISPALSWDKPSNEIKSFAIIAEDPDSPGGNFVHWVAYNIPANITRLPEDVTPIKNIPDEVLLGTNNFGHIGYGGPCPPSGTHRYYFRIYGLNSVVHLEAGAEKGELMRAMQKNIIAEGELMGKYSRQK